MHRSEVLVFFLYEFILSIFIGFSVYPYFDTQKNYIEISSIIIFKYLLNTLYWVQILSNV